MYNFLILVPYNYLLEGAQILIQYNATLVLYWHTNSIVVSVNIGDNDFSYVIYSILHNTSIELSQVTVENKDNIKNFYEKLNTCILT